MIHFISDTSNEDQAFNNVGPLPADVRQNNAEYYNRNALEERYMLE